MQKRRFSGKELEELSLPVIRRLLSDAKIRAAKTVLMYYSLPDEVFTHNVIDRLVNEGKTVLLPHVTDGENMELREYESRSDLAAGCYGILEPSGRVFDDYGRIDVAVVPGMSFDADCNRLGRGKGYYDRFLAKIPDLFKIGVCFDFQKLDHIPADGNDVRMDKII